MKFCRINESMTSSIRFVWLFSLGLLLCSCDREVYFASRSFDEENPRNKSVSSRKKHASKGTPYSDSIDDSESIGLREEFFSLKPKNQKLDILVLVDASSSINLESLGSSLSDLLWSIKDYDWQIGFTTVDHGDHHFVKDNSRQMDRWQDQAHDSFPRFGNLMPLENGMRIFNQKLLTPDTPNYETVFLHTISHYPERDCNRPPYCHYYLEQPLRSLKSAIERAHFDNTDLFRPKTDFVSLIITNEEERSEDPERATKPKEVIDTFEKVFHRSNKKFIAFNILVLDEDCQTQEMERNEKVNKSVAIASTIATLATRTGGDNISICEEHYGPFLRDISKTIKNYVENTVWLKEYPKSTVQVEFLKGEPIPWTVSGRKLVFQGRPSEGTEIRVRY